MPNITTNHAITCTNLITIGDTKEIKRKNVRNKQKLDKNLNCRRLTSWLCTKRVGLVFENPSSGRGNLNLERPDYKSRDLTTRPRHCCLFPFRLIRDILTNWTPLSPVTITYLSLVLFINQEFSF